MSAPRVWWTFRVFGAKERFHARRRDAGLEGARPPDRSRRGRNGRRASSTPRWTPARWPCSATCKWRSTTIARRWWTRAPAGRFAGRDPEPRPGLRPGHMPGALSVPSTELIGERPAVVARAHRRRLQKSRRRHRPAGDHQLRLRRLRRDPRARPRRARQETGARL